jgi:hypothetical protein
MNKKFTLNFITYDNMLINTYELYEYITSKDETIVKIIIDDLVNLNIKFRKGSNIKDKFLRLIKELVKITSKYVNLTFKVVAV